MNMKLNKILLLLSVAALALAACTREEVPATPASGEESGDRVTIEVGISIPEANLATKAMANDPSISNIYIAVFTYKNYLKEFVKAIPLNDSNNPNLDGSGNYVYTPDGSGKYKVRFSLEKTTSERHVHVLANVPESLTPPDFDYVDKVLGENLYCSGTQDGYWYYIHFADGTGISDSSVSAFNDIKMVRNFVQVSLEATVGSGFTVNGFELYNTPTRGSFLPYKGKDTSGATPVYNFCTSWETAGNATGYTTLLASYSGYLIPGSTPLYRPSYGAGDFPANTDPKFMYEHPASQENPTYIIAKLTKAGDTKFYRLDILDNDGNKSALIRNYHYTVTVNSISTVGANSPAEAEQTPSDYNFTLSKETESVDNIYSNGAMMEVEYVEKVFTKASADVPFSYRYNPDVTASSYEKGSLSAVTGSGEVTPGWTVGASGTGPSDGWYSTTYSVADPSSMGSDELVSTFTVTAGTGAKNIVRKISIVSMKPKTLDVSVWSYNGSNTLNLTYTIPGGLRPSMFPLQLKYQIDKDPANGNKQILSPQTAGLVTDYEDDATVIFLEDIYYSDYNPVSGATITIQFMSPITSTTPPVLHISDTEGYFVPQNLGASYVSGLYADPIAKGGLHTTVLEFNYTADTDVPITLNLTGLEIDPNYVIDPSEGSLSGNVFTPDGKGPKHIGLRATSSNIDSNGTVGMTASVSGLPNPADLTVSRYSQYVTGALVQHGDLPLGEGSTTTFSFDYSARDMLPVTISAPNVEIWNADGSSMLGDGSYTYTPAAKGTQTFTIKAKTHFASAGNVSLSVPNMTNPAALAIKRAHTFVIPTSALSLTGTDHFQEPVYWRTNQRRSTSGVLGLSHYFSSSQNTGNITIDISEISNPNDDTVLYFMYTYTAYLVILPITRYMYAHATLEQLIEATAGSPQTLTFSHY